jgi:hypothetical protein
LTYYVRQVPGSGMQVWRIADDEAVQLGVTNPKEGPGSYFKAEPDEAIWSAIRRLATGWFEPEGTCPFHKLALAPGHYYPRIARPYMQNPTDGLGWNPNGRVEGSAIAVARGQLATLVRQLERICQAIHPAPDIYTDIKVATPKRSRSIGGLWPSQRKRSVPSTPMWR